MILSDSMLKGSQLRIVNELGELFPDPNLISNIDHMSAFVDIELECWLVHSRKIDLELKSSNEIQSTVIVFDELNTRIYLKSLLSVCTYYIACVEAIEKLMKQMYRINMQHRCGLKKPKLQDKVDVEFHKKVRSIRNKSFIHQDSTEIPNPMDKRTAMDWNVTTSKKSGELSSCEDYCFGSCSWWVEVNGVKTEASIDIKVAGFSDFCTIAIEQLNIRKKRARDYFKLLSEKVNLNKT